MTQQTPKVTPAAAHGAKPSLLSRLRNNICRKIKAENGTATIEFVLCIPVIMAIFMASIESGVLMTRFILLERSVDMVMRNLRLGQYPNPSVNLIKDEICRRTIIMKSCESSIAIEMMPISTATWVLPNSSIGCVDREEVLQPALTFNPGAAHQIMLVRVCVVQDAMFPTTGIGLKLPKDALGGYNLVATSAFVNEP
jgi:hypothetical protein